MNGPLSMYKLKPIVHFPDPVDITPTMYGMKNIYSKSKPHVCSSDVIQQTQSLPNVEEQKSTTEVEDLKKRQEGILRQLNFLKEQMLSLREELSKESSNKNPSSEMNSITMVNSHHNIASNPQWNGVVGEIVINASPEHPPYSLLALKQLCSDSLRIQVVFHTHSSVITLPNHLSCFYQLSRTDNPNVHVRLIWSNMGPDCEMVVSPVSHSPVRGEVNVLRYFHRSVFGFSDPLADIQLDNMLDVCHRLAHAHTQRDRQISVRVLNALLGRAPWLGGESPSVADVAAWSVIKNTAGVELSQNMTRWSARCVQAFEASAA